MRILLTKERRFQKRDGEKEGGEEERAKIEVGKRKKS